MSGRWSVYWDADDGVWRAEPNDWRVDVDPRMWAGFGSWSEALDFADRSARGAADMTDAITHPHGGAR